MTDPSPASTERDPFAPVPASPRGAGTLALLALAAAVLSIVGGLAPVAGPVGMALGLISHVKGSRWGLPAAGVAGVATVVGFTITFLLR